MSFPAARIGDMTMHGGTISVGTPLTLIGGKPASRIGDMHVCPMVTPAVPPIPHVGGPILLGAFNVLTGGPPQSRVMDMCICVGPPSMVALGHFTTLVGMAGAFGGGLGGFLGLVAGGLLAGLDNMAGGYPRAVRRPDGTIVTEYSPNITITGSPEYQAAVIADLNHPDNRATVEALNRENRHVTISPIPAHLAQDNGWCRPASNGAYATGLNGQNITRGAGSDSDVYYNPTYSQTYTGEDGNTYTQPPRQVLRHELGHALHNARGENLRNFPDAHGDNQEEARNIGVHGWEGEGISDRPVSQANGASPRPDHDSVTGWEYQGTDGQWREGSYDAGGNEVTNPIPNRDWPPSR